MTVFDLELDGEGPFRLPVFVAFESLHADPGEPLQLRLRTQQGKEVWIPLSVELAQKLPAYLSDVLFREERKG